MLRCEKLLLDGRQGDRSNPCAVSPHGIGVRASPNITFSEQRTYVEGSHLLRRRLRWKNCRQRATPTATGDDFPQHPQTRDPIGQFFRLAHCDTGPIHRHRGTMKGDRLASEDTGQGPLACDCQLA